MVVVVVVVAVVVVVVVMVVRVGWSVAVVMLRHGAAQTAHRLLHVGVVRWRLHLERPLGGVGLVARRPDAMVTHVIDVVAEEAAVALRKEVLRVKRSADRDTDHSRTLPKHALRFSVCPG